jgi:acid phosphatase type 7
VSFRIRTLPLIAAGVAVVAVAGVAAASATNGNDWPHADAAKGQQYTLVAVGDIACEPADNDNLGNPAALTCIGSRVNGVGVGLIRGSAVALWA